MLPDRRSPRRLHWSVEPIDRFSHASSTPRDRHEMPRPSKNRIRRRWDTPAECPAHDPFQIGCAGRINLIQRLIECGNGESETERNQAFSAQGGYPRAETTHSAMALIRLQCSCASRHALGAQTPEPISVRQASAMAGGEPRCVGRPRTGSVDTRLIRLIRRSKQKSAVL